MKLEEHCAAAVYSQGRMFLTHTLTDLLVLAPCVGALRQREPSPGV